MTSSSTSTVPLSVTSLDPKHIRAIPRRKREKEIITMPKARILTHIPTPYLIFLLYIEPLSTLLGAYCTYTPCLPLSPKPFHTFPLTLPRRLPNTPPLPLTNPRRLNPAPFHHSHRHQHHNPPGHTHRPLPTRKSLHSFCAQRRAGASLYARRESLADAARGAVGG